MKAPLFLPFLFLILGIFFGQLFSWGLYFAIPLIGCVLLGLSTRRAFFTLLAIFCLGSLLIQKESNPRQIGNYLDVPIVQPIVGEIVSEVDYSKDREGYRFVLSLDSVAGVEAEGLVQFWTEQAGLKYGQVVRCVAELRTPESAVNPYGFDYAQYLEQRSIYALGSNKTLLEVIEQKGNFFWHAVYKSRQWMLARMEARFGEYSAFLQTILLGKRMEDSGLRESFTKAGVAHILAISGLHIGVISLIIFLLLRIFIPRIWLVRTITISFLLFYAALCGFTPSVTRAVLMISLGLWAMHLERIMVLDNIVATAGIIILLIKPEFALSISFQLSFLAVLVLANLVPRISLKFEVLSNQRHFKFLHKKLPFLVNSMLSSFVVSLATIPITLYYFNQINFNGVFANLICVPLAGFIVPLSFVCLFTPIFHLEYSIALKALIDVLFWFVKLFADFPFHYGSISRTFFLPVVVSAIFLLASVYFVRKRKRFKTVIVFLLIAILPWGYFLIPRDRSLRITFFDCGLGDMTLISTPEGKNIFVDVGPPDFVRSFKKTAVPYLAEKGIRSIDFLVLTHAHNDHFGGVWHAFEELNIKRVVVTENFAKSKIWQRFSQVVKDEGSELVVLQDTGRLLQEEDLSIMVVHPAKDFWDADINNMSIVLRLDFKEFSALLTGDLEKEGEEFILPLFDLDCDLLKVGHHGSKSSSTKPFIKEVSPEYAFIFTSVKNRFHFPHNKTLQAYEFLGENLFVTGESGAIEISTDGHSAHFKTYKSKREFTDFTLDE